MQKMIRSFVTIAAALVATSVFAAPPSAKSLEHAQALASKATLTDVEIGEIATALGSPTYVVLYDNQGLQFVEFGAGLIKLGDGVGEVFGPASELTRGVFWNFSNETVWLGDGKGEPVYEVRPNGIVVVGGDVNQAAAAVASGPSVTCGAGYYACCCQNSGGSSRTYTCIANGSPHNCNRPATGCTGGGPGATSCTMAASAAVIDIADGDGSTTNP